MGIKDFMSKHQAGKDERLVAESNKIYRVGYIVMNVGFLAWSFYLVMKNQVMMVNDLTESVIFTSTDIAMFLLFLTTNIICSWLSIRKGFVDDGRYGEADAYPASYILVMSAGVAAMVLVLSTLLRSLAEIELLGLGNVHWLANGAIGCVFATMTFIVALLAFSISYWSAKSRREKLLRDAMDG